MVTIFGRSILAFLIGSLAVLDIGLGLALIGAVGLLLGQLVTHFTGWDYQVTSASAFFVVLFGCLSALVAAAAGTLTRR